MSTTFDEPAAIHLSPPSSPSNTTSAEFSSTCPTTGPLPPKKKKKKKSKKATKQTEQLQTHCPDSKTPVLAISRNKHWKYISSYHGPWLQLPIELLDSLSILNEDPATFNSSDARSQLSLSTHAILPHQEADRPLAGSFQGQSRDTRLLTPTTSSLNLAANSGRTLPPPIDPGVFRSVVAVRRLIDEAAELSVRASSGLSQAELTAMRNPTLHTSWGLSQTLGIGLPSSAHGGRNVTMSAMRIHRLRVLAVQKLAQAYRMDEVASSVMVMQGGTVFDDLAQRVLKVDPNDADAKYVNFFHEKIPSRQLAECTTTRVLDELIATQPQRLEYHRTRGIVHSFRNEFPQATKDFTYALKEARAVRKAKLTHRNNVLSTEGKSKTHKKKGNKGSACHPASDTERAGRSSLTESLSPHPSTLPDAPEPIEPQLLFLRGSAHLQHAIFLIEEAIIQLEGISKHASFEGAELRLCNLDVGRYGGVEVRNPDGPLGKSTGPKAVAYREILADATFSTSITNLLQKSIRDHEKFVGHFDTVETTTSLCEGDLARRTEYAFFLTESIRPGNHSHSSRLCSDIPAVISAYHPLLVEAHFTILLCLMILGDFSAVLARLQLIAALMDGLEGCPIFLPPRSMAQAEFVETLERLANGWSPGTQPHSLANVNGKARLLIGDGEDERGSTPSPPSSFPTSPGGGPSRPSPCHLPTSPPHSDGHTAVDSLDSIRILLAPVIKRQNQRAEEKIREDAQPENSKKKMPINIPLHGPRVEIILAWLGAVHLPQLEIN